jgi:hypothetical protein
LIQTAAADHRPLTSGVSPSSGIPSPVTESRPLIAHFTLDHPLRVRKPRRRADVDHLVDHRRQRDRGARHPCDQRAPYAAADHHQIGVEVAAGRADALNASLRDIDAENHGVSGHGHPARDRAFAHDRAGAQRVDDARARRLEAAEDQRLVDERDELFDLGGRDQRHRDSEADICRQLTYQTR